MLGKLARWLRLLGFDTAYCSDIDDARLIRLAREEDRVLLTRDTRLCMTRPVARGEISAVLFSGDDLYDQLMQLLAELDLEQFKAAGRMCPKCNAPTREASAQEARGRVPSYVLKIHRDFTFCARCGSFYWKGSHWKAIKRNVMQIRKKRADRAGPVTGSHATSSTD